MKRCSNEVPAMESDRAAKRPLPSVHTNPFLLTPQPYNSSQEIFLEPMPNFGFKVTTRQTWNHDQAQQRNYFDGRAFGGLPQYLPLPIGHERQTVPFSGNQNYPGPYSRRYDPPSLQLQFGPGVFMNGPSYDSARNRLRLTPSSISFLPMADSDDYFLPLPRFIPQKLVIMESISQSLFGRSLKKQALGELLFPFVEGMYPEFAEKITGMILEMQNDEIEDLLKNPHEMRTRIHEGMYTLAQLRIQQEVAAMEAPQPNQ